jgi:diguanylate cyclase (GGDEF)-like protein
LASLDDLVFELDEHGTYLRAWTTDESLLVAPRNELLGQTLGEALGEEIGPRLFHALRRALGTGRPEIVEYCLEVPAGTRWFQGRLAPILGPGGHQTVCLLVRDITAQELAESARREAEGQLRRQALYDGLTGLPNRALFRERLDHELKVARRALRDLAVLMLDVDRFKEINDTLGHSAGDEVLKEFARRLSAVTRESDSVARLGGDEFAVLLSSVSEDDGARVVARLSKSLEAPILVDDLPLHIDVSVGMAAFRQDGEDVDLLLRRADIAMYLAKAANAGFALYDGSLDPHQPDRLALAGELRGALDRGELVLHYQPQLSLSEGGGVVAAEALLRWQHPRRGLIPPDDFIPTVQETSLIKPLTHYVLDRALRQCRAWMDQGRPLRVAVNLAMRNLIDEDLPRDVAELLRLHAVPPHLLELEITESSVVADPRRTEPVLARLAGIGTRLSVDDFGTGYSSLTYLMRLPVAGIKIDRTFVTEMATAPEKAVIARSIIDLAHNLGKEVVAEGVETADVLAILQGLGCHLAQGYLMSPPLPADKFTSWLDDNRWLDYPAGS